MTKENEIKEWTEYCRLHLSDMIPHDTPNYEEVLLEESKKMAEALYEYQHNPKGFENVESQNNILDLDLPF
jgi:hypothetical protein